MATPVCPELSDIERTWRDLKQHHLAHHTFEGVADLTATIHAAVRQLNNERMIAHPCYNLENAAQLHRNGSLQAVSRSNPSSRRARVVRGRIASLHLQ